MNNGNPQWPQQPQQWQGQPQQPPQQQWQQPAPQPQPAPQQGWGPPPNQPPQQQWQQPPQQQQWQQPQQPFSGNPPQQPPQQQWNGQQPPQMPGPPTALVQQPPPSGPPAIFIPDEAIVQAAYAKAAEDAQRIAKARSGQGNFTEGSMRFFKPWGPKGETNWENVPIGYEASYRIWICPAPLAGMMPLVEEKGHFAKSHRLPQGETTICTHEPCLICYARQLLFKSGDEAQAEWARNHGKPATKQLMQILLLDYPASHVASDGKMYPWVFRASGGVATTILDKFKSRGIVKCIDPQYGRPFRLTKWKKGAGLMEVGWKIDDEEPAPLPADVYPALYNLFDLRKIIKTPSGTQVQQALQDMQLPVTAEMQARLQQMIAADQARVAQLAAAPAAQVGPGGFQASFNPNPAPPMGNPYQQAPGQPLQPQQVHPQGGPPVNMPPGGWPQTQNPYQGQQQWDQAPPQQPQQPQQWQQQQGPPPGQWGQQPQPSNLPPGFADQMRGR